MIVAGKFEGTAARSSVIAPTYFPCGMTDTMAGVLRGMGSAVAPSALRGNR